MITTSNQTQLGDGLLVCSFILGGAVFGIDAQEVQEVARVGDIAPVHQSAPEVVGIRNLRGRIVTVLDLRVCLNLGRVGPSAENRILIVSCQGEPVGLLVDSVADTVAVEPGGLAPPPPNLHGLQGRTLRGVCRGEDRLVALLDLETLFGSDSHAVQTADVELRNS